jgi:hypothetical protein
MTPLHPILIRGLARERLYGVEPPSSPLWLKAPPHLRRRYLDGYIDKWAWWNQLARWLEFEERVA